jgi:hypothetical protein
VRVLPQAAAKLETSSQRHKQASGNNTIPINIYQSQNAILALINSLIPVCEPRATLEGSARLLPQAGKLDGTALANTGPRL